LGTVTQLILKRASVGSNQEDYDVLADDKVVGRIFLAARSPRGTAWMWTLAHEDRIPTHGYEPTREAAMAAFAKSWRRES
jgi:hypothetical protein